MSDYYKSLAEYYKTPEWAKKRAERLKLDGFKCAKCGFTRALEVHHINYERIYNEDVSRDLITLCKKCHKEVEDQKQTINPIEKPSEHHSVYLAGKISKNNWRNAFFKYRGFPDDPEDIANGAVIELDGMTITGPFFISCDHGCYHGEGSHGVGAAFHNQSEEFVGCYGNFYEKADVLNICKRQIDDAELLFAYIDCEDCFGTLAEIGYAHAKGKSIVIRFANKELFEKMWFVYFMDNHKDNISEEWLNSHIYSKYEFLQR